MPSTTTRITKFLTITLSDLQRLGLAYLFYFELVFSLCLDNIINYNYISYAPVKERQDFF